METLFEEFINEDLLTQAPIKKKKLLPAAQYLKSFKETHAGIKSVDIEIFYNILEHLIEWEKMEINDAIFNTSLRLCNSKTYIADKFENYEG
jgi:hypothetical protein